MRHIDHLVVHCAATPEGKPFTVKDIDRWHRERGFRCIGYHYVIYLDGSIHPGRPVEEIGAHVKGHNRSSIGICYIGGVAADGRTAKDTRTPAQKEALETFLRSLKRKYPGAAILGHRDFPKVRKACPSFNAKKEYAHIK
ncbi:N-acetylmuramoyl-L-alanine amidase [Martelella mangrovi]|uniref:N-acetylmuramoyl-L-alanine amidase n=1 Tax=Martelella mangrovi TaxID=1397477 RepID=A0ABV2IG54_9HYPH